MAENPDKIKTLDAELERQLQLIESLRYLAEKIGQGQNFDQVKSIETLRGAAQLIEDLTGVREPPGHIHDEATLLAASTKDNDTLTFEGLVEPVYLDTEFDWDKAIIGETYRFEAHRDGDGDLVLRRLERV